MNIKHIQPKYLSVVSLLILILNIQIVHSPILGFVCAVLYIFTIGRVFAQTFFQHDKRLWGVLLFFLYMLIAGAGIYFLWNLSNPVIFGILALPVAVTLLFTRKHSIAPNTTPLKFQPSWRFYFFFVGFLFFFLAALLVLIEHPIIEAVRSPWLALPHRFWILLLIALFSFFFLFMASPKNLPQRKRLLFHLAPACMLVFLFTGLALILYPYGFGFDPFVHQATEKAIFDHGVITPKPYYYLGQYALVVMLAKMFQANIVTVDRLLLPLAASFTLIPTMYYALKHMIHDARTRILTSTLLLAWPLTFFITTTPQALSNLLLLLVIFLCFEQVWHNDDRRRLQEYTERASAYTLLPFILALASLAIHPLSGIPAVLFVLIFFCFSSQRLLSRIFGALILFFSSGIFLMLFGLKKNTTTISLSTLFAPPRIANKFLIVQDFIYTYAFNIHWIVLLFMFGGTWIVYKKTKKKRVFLFPVFFLAMILNYLLVTIYSDFSFLISYEQQNYAIRIFEIAFYFLFPLALVALSSFLQKLFEQQRWTKIFFAFVFAIILATSLYLSYPQHNRYVTGRNFNLTPTDIQAVHFIKKDATGKKYAVLANQMVSAAALQEFGFVNFYQTQNGELFYYPIPTSSPTYEIYLEMVNRSPTRERALQAMNLMQTDIIYLVLNDYWWGYETLVEQAKKNADEVFSIENGKITIVKYHRYPRL